MRSMSLANVQKNKRDKERFLCAFFFSLHSSQAPSLCESATPIQWVFTPYLILSETPSLTNLQVCFTTLLGTLTIQINHYDKLKFIYY